MPNDTRYRVEDREILLGFFQRAMWTPLVTKIPAWIRPNAITVFGQICVLLAAVAAAAAVPGPNILYLVSAVLLMTYVTADNVDGPHARRTGQTSPLGEFLDHGLDGMASGAVILSACFALRLDGVLMVALCGLGAIGFMLTFWEQFRTGVLVLPKFSAIEGLVAVMLAELIVFFGNEPAFMAFSFERINVASAVIFATLLGYTVAVFAPIWRVRARGTAIRELWAPLTIGGATLLYSVAGASGLLPAITVTLFGADVVCRLILLRHGRIQGRGIVRPGHWLILLPLIPAFALPEMGTPEVWAASSTVIMVGLYVLTLYRGGVRILAAAAE